jgi:filamentous hemagglutinin family protein
MHKHRFFLACVLAGFASLLGSPVQAQINPDQTLEYEESIVTPDVKVRGSLADLIEGGAVRGSNLFHSFSDFNVLESERVYFANPSGIESILSRITGDRVSNIFGTLGVDGTADLFLINPNGIVFGLQASLDIEGSFYGTTAEALPLGDGVFSAANPEQSQLLIVKPNTSFFRYLTPSSGDIVNRGHIGAEEELSLVANSLNLRGAVVAGSDLSLTATDSVQIRDTPNEPFVAFAGGNLRIQGNDQVDILALAHPESGLFSYGSMVLQSEAPIIGDAHYLSGKHFSIEGLDGGSGTLYSPNDPIIRALGNVDIQSYQGTSLHILAGGSVNIGTATIEAPDMGVEGVDYLEAIVSLSNGELVAINGGENPTLDVRAGIQPEAIGVPPIEILTGFNLDSDIFTEAFANDLSTGTDITIGDVLITAPNGLILLTNQYQPNNEIPGGDILINATGDYARGINVQSSIGKGGLVFLDSRGDILLEGLLGGIDSSSMVDNGGDITLIADETVSLDGVFSSITTNRGGNIQVLSNHFSMSPFTALTTFRSDTGLGGNILIQTTESVFINDGVVGSVPAFAENIGNSGNIDIKTEDLTVVGRRSAISSRTLNNEPAGDITVEVNRLQLTGGSEILASTDTRGDAGSISIDASEFVEATGAEPGFGNIIRSGITTDTRGSGAAGNLTITTPSLRVLDGARLGAQVQNDASGRGGNVVVNAANILIENGGQITAGTFGTGIGGTLTINDADSVVVRESDGEGSPSGIFTATYGYADANDLIINTRNLSILEGGQISASSLGIDTGRGGNLTINATGAVNVAGSSSDGEFRSALAVSSGFLLGTTFQGAVGDGGNLIVNSGDFTVRDAGFVSAQAFGTGVRDDFPRVAGNAGNLTITSTGRVELSHGVLQTSTIGPGNAGDITLQARELIIRDLSETSASTVGNRQSVPGVTGRGGKITVIVDDSIELIGEGGIATLSAFGGDAGDISIRSGSLSLRDGASITAAAIGDGQAGNININAGTSLEIIGGRFIRGTDANDLGGFEVFSPDEEVFSPSQITTDFGSLNGNLSASDLLVSTEQLLIAEGGRITTRTLGDNPGGNLKIASNTIELRGTSASGEPSELSAQAISNGDAGSIAIDTERLSLTENARILASARDDGNAGDISIRSGESVNLTDSEITTSALQSSGGNIFVLSDELRLLGDSDIKTFVDSGSGSGGNVELVADSIVVLDSSDILAFSVGGAGGNILLDTPAFFREGYRASSQEPNLSQLRTLDDNNLVDINATGLVSSGAITVPSVNFIENDLAELANNLVDSDALVANSCIARNGGTTGTFTLTSGNRLPQSPNEFQVSVYPLGIVEPVSSDAATVTPGIISEPQSVYQLSDGRLIMSRDC